MLEIMPAKCVKAYLSLRMAWMEMDSNLKKLVNFFKF